MRKAINRHIEDFRCGFTLEFDVKNPPLNPDIQISEDNANFENEMYTFHNIHAQACFDEIMNLPDVELQITGWNFAGRSGGWFVLECDGDDDIDLGSKDIAAIEEVVEKYHKSFFQEMANFYNPCETRNFYGVSIVPVEGKSDVQAGRSEGNAQREGRRRRRVRQLRGVLRGRQRRNAGKHRRAGIRRNPDERAGVPGIQGQDKQTVK